MNIKRALIGAGAVGIFTSHWYLFKHHPVLGVIVDLASTATIVWSREIEREIRLFLDGPATDEEVLDARPNFVDPSKSVFPGLGTDGMPDAWTGGCGCWTCTSERVQNSAHPWSMPFIVCPDCGNKRCPRAMHHDNECTNSNEPGQPGSRFEHVKPFTDDA